MNTFSGTNQVVRRVKVYVCKPRTSCHARSSSKSASAWPSYSYFRFLRASRDDDTETRLQNDIGIYRLRVAFASSVVNHERSERREGRERTRRGEAWQGKTSKDEQRRLARIGSAGHADSATTDSSSDFAFAKRDND